MGSHISSLAAPRYPDFYIIGAPKCGTTALYSYLRECPGVFLPESKEPDYFNPDIVKRHRSFEAYAKLFANAPAQSLWGEGSIWYLYSAVAVPNIVRVRPDAKFIVMLRNPPDAVQALHSMRLTLLDEDIQDLEEAWEAQHDRSRGLRIPPHSVAPTKLLYGSVYSYYRQLERVLKIIPRSQLHIVIYEEFFHDPKAHFLEIENFLGVEPQGRTEFHRVNANRSPRNLAVHRFLSHPPFPLSILSAPLRFLSKKFGLRLGRLSMMLMDIQTNKRPPMRAEFRKKLELFFRDDVLKLEDLLGRRIDVWRDPPAAD